ncbi:hypothetical protein [Streptomyces filamentosus]|uniref:hypothetical protein n=1 Tax=Streptomyces filamentosus TaxID=67294 RepID=UPI0037D722F0
MTYVSGTTPSASAADRPAEPPRPTRAWLFRPVPPPTGPGEPAEAAAPVESVELTEPAELTASAEPVDLTEPAERTEPVDLVEPAESSEPVDLTEPVEPVERTEPLAPPEPAPATPARPAAPLPSPSPGPRLLAPFVDSPASPPGADPRSGGGTGAGPRDGSGPRPDARPRLGSVPLPETPRAAARRRELPVVRAVRLGSARGEPSPAPGGAPAPPAAVTPVPLPLPRAAGTTAVPHESSTEEPPQ